MQPADRQHDREDVRVYIFFHRDILTVSVQVRRAQSSKRYSDAGDAVYRAAETRRRDA